jgi:hypothetical protein
MSTLFPAADRSLADNVQLILGNGDGSGTFDGSISGHGSVAKYGDGNQTLTGIHAFDGNATTTIGGKLVVANTSGVAFAGKEVDVLGTSELMVNNAGGKLVNPAAAVYVDSDGTLSGSGDLGGELHVLAGGRTRIGGVGDGTMNMRAWDSANLSSLRFLLGAPDAPANSRVKVVETLNLDGVISVSPQAGFRAGTYRLFDYGGELIEHEVLFENVPAGYTFVLDKSMPGQINLIVSGGPVDVPGPGQGLIYLPATSVNLIAQ